MPKLIQYSTKASLYDGAFGGDAGWSAAGMGYIFVDDEGDIIVIDGGFGEDASEIVSLIKNNSPCSVPNVKLWIITHPHVDHYGALREIANNEKYHEEIKIEKILYWFPMEFCGKDGVPGVLAKANEHLGDIISSLGAEHHRPSLDEKIAIGGLEFHFLYVPDDCSILNTGGGNANLCSLIFTVQSKNKKVMITGDAYNRTMQITSWRYHKKLECDILQMPHHGLCDAYNADFYREVNPRILLIPISIAGCRSMHSDMYAAKDGRNINLDLEKNAEIVYKAFEGTKEIEL